jgi:hypothetical protein
VLAGMYFMHSPGLFEFEINIYEMKKAKLQEKQTNFTMTVMRVASLETQHDLPILGLLSSLDIQSIKINKSINQSINPRYL